MTFETLQQEMYSAMKSGDKFRKEVISGLIADIKRVAIDKNCRDNITEEVVNTVLLKSRKMAQEMIDTCPAERAETLAAYNEKMKIIKEFAPQLLTDPVEIKASVEAILAEAGIEPVKKNKGLVMKTLMPKFKGKADMGVVNQVIGEVLV